MTKEENGNQDVGATAFDYPNMMNPRPRAPIYYGNQNVPKPCNYKAEMVDAPKVMKATIEGK